MFVLHQLRKVDGFQRGIGYGAVAVRRSLEQDAETARFVLQHKNEIPFPGHLPSTSLNGFQTSVVANNFDSVCIDPETLKAEFLEIWKEQGKNVEGSVFEVA